MKKILYLVSITAVLLLAACGGNDSTESEPVEGNDTIEQEPTSNGEWVNKINEIANNESEASEKFYELETFLLEYEPSTEEVRQFEKDIVNEYKSGNYLSDLENHEYMLTNIFKTYFVEKNNPDDSPIAQFAFDMHQNLKYTYRGVDVVDSEAVKSNEEQMNELLSEIE